jgi:cytoskeletal protein RodZ
MGQHTTQPNQHQVEALAQIGGYLHDVRENQLLSLEQVSTQTMIQARLLRAIETADFHQLPEPIYIRGFIRRYAEALGLNGSDVASQFPVELDKRAIEPSWTQASPHLRPTHLWLAYTAIIIVAIGALHQYLTRFYSPINQSANTVEVPETVTDSESGDSIPPGNDSAVENPLPSNNPSSETESPLLFSNTETEGVESDSPLQVTIELTQRSWLRVVIDGQPELEEVLPEGTQRTWTGNEEITIRAGNAGGVLLARGNDEAELMGDPGAVQEVTFSVDDPVEESSEDDANAGIVDASPTASQTVSQ